MSPNLLETRILFRFLSHFAPKGIFAAQPVAPGAALVLTYIMEHAKVRFRVRDLVLVTACLAIPAMSITPVHGATGYGAESSRLWQSDAEETGEEEEESDEAPTTTTTSTQEDPDC